jgi:hypothetical protein
VFSKAVLILDLQAQLLPIKEVKLAQWASPAQ